MELYHKQNVSHITTIAVYEDGSCKQICYDPTSKEVQFYRACVDVEGGCRFFRYTKFCIDVKDLDVVINNIHRLKDEDEVLIELATKHNKRLVFALNEQYGNWDLGFQKKVVVQKRKAVMVDLAEDEDLDQNVPNQKNIRVEILKPDYDVEMGRFDCIKFKKNEDFDYIADRMLEFRRELFESYPHLRSKHIEVPDINSGVTDQYFKKNIDVFKYLTFQMNVDKENRSISRIALLRQYANDLKACSDAFDLNFFVKFEKDVFHYCKILRATHNASSRQQESSGASCSSSYTRSSQASSKKQCRKE